MTNHVMSRSALLRRFALPLALTLASGTVSAQERVQELIPDIDRHHKFFAEVLAIDGDTAVMGDHNYMMEGNCGQQEHGAVQVYKKVGGVWQEAEFFRYLDDNTDTQRHGWSVAIKGNVIVAATPGQRWVNGNEVRMYTGALTVYKRPDASSPFTFDGQVFVTNPDEHDNLGFHRPMASNGVYAAATSLKHSSEIQIFRVHPTRSHLTTISYPNNAEPRSLFITNQNILVADSGLSPAPLAWKLDGAQATPVDTSGLAGSPYDSTTGFLTGDGDSVAWIVRDGGWPQDLLRIAKFGPNSVVSVTTDYLPQGGIGQPSELPMTLKEDQGLFFGRQSDFLSSYKYVGGSYRYQGKVFHSGLTLRSLAFNGTDLLVGDRTPQHPTNVPCGGNMGSIWVYRPMAPSSSGPGVSTKLQPWSHTPVFNNGASVAMSGSFAVSATPDTYQGDAPGGSVFLYQNVSGAWQQIEEFVDTWSGLRSAEWSGFGAAVDINPNHLAIGVPMATNMYGAQTGTVQVVRKSTNGQFFGGAWLTEVDSPSYDEAGESFGASVALAGNTLFVGAPAWGSGPGSPYAGGSVYVFTWTGSYWEYVQQIRNPTIQPYEGFGYRVSASGDNLIVGIPYRSTNGHYANGAAEIFRKDPSTGSYVSAGEFWAPFGLQDYANFGLSVSMGANYAAAGSPAGSVVVYRRSGSTWSQHPGMPITSPQWGFGTSVAVDGSGLVVGSPWESRVHRYVRITFWGAAWWSLSGTLVGPTSSFGTSVDMESGLVSIGESYGVIGNQSVGASYVLNFANIQ